MAVTEAELLIKQRDLRRQRERGGEKFTTATTAVAVPSGMLFQNHHTATFCSVYRSHASHPL